MHCTLQHWFYYITHLSFEDRHHGNNVQSFMLISKSLCASGSFVQLYSVRFHKQFQVHNFNNVWNILIHYFWFSFKFFLTHTSIFSWKLEIFMWCWKHQITWFTSLVCKFFWENNFGIVYSILIYNFFSRKLLFSIMLVPFFIGNKKFSCDIGSFVKLCSVRFLT